MAVTPASFKTAKPQFADVPDPTVQSYLDMSALIVDSSWPSGWADQATIAYTCHLMTLEGLGTDMQSEAFASTLAFYSTIRSGEMTLSRIAKSSNGGTMTYTGWLGQTTCGQYFLMLLGMLRGGPVTVSISSPGPLTGYAKDWPGVYAGSIP